MSQTGFTDATFANGNSVKSSTDTQLNKSINDNDTRLMAIEGTEAVRVLMNSALTGFVNQYSPQEVISLRTIVVPVNMTLDTFVITITDNSTNASNANVNIPFETGSPGVLECTVERANTSTNAWESVTSQNAAIQDGISGRFTKSNNGIFSVANVDEGELLRVRTVSFKDQQGSFHVELRGEAR